jgi:AraC family transcriptional regulator of adaptative response/methylated-DNA-[protein]-cysteine methyltransferase
MMIDEQSAWSAVLSRDRSADGSFVTGVLTTGIYCRPSCAARHPRRENVRFFATGAEAAATGLRPCLRCRPDDITRDAAAMERALAWLEKAETPPSLSELANAAGYSPHHFHRLFKRHTGLTPAQYARGRRARNMASSLEKDGSVTDAIYDAGYSGPARFYADAKARLGMTPSAWRGGGRGETICWATAETSLGTMMVAATERGICRLSFDEGEEELRRRFPNAAIKPGGEAMAELVRRTVGANCLGSRRARASAMQRLRRAPAGPAPCGRRGRHAAPTKSQSSSPAIAPAAATARQAASPTG